MPLGIPEVKPMEMDDDHSLPAAPSPSLLESLIKFKQQIREAAEINLDEYKESVKDEPWAESLVAVLMELKKFDSALKTIADSELLDLPKLKKVIDIYQPFFNVLHTPDPITANFDALKTFLSPLCPYLMKTLGKLSTKTLPF